MAINFQRIAVVVNGFVRIITAEIRDSAALLNAKANRFFMRMQSATHYNFVIPANRIIIP